MSSKATATEAAGARPNPKKHNVATTMKAESMDEHREAKPPNTKRANEYRLDMTFMANSPEGPVPNREEPVSLSKFAI